MKNPIFIACALFVSLFVNATEEGTIMEEVVVVPQKSSPTGVKSSPNQQGDMIEVFYRDDIEEDYVAAIRKSDGKLYFLCELEYGRLRPLVVPITNQIFWLSDREFACVSSGRRFSHYAIYRISVEAPVPQAIEAFSMVRGCAHYRVQWKVEGKTLVGYDVHEEKTIVLKS